MLTHIHLFLQRFACEHRPIFNGVVLPGPVSRTIQGPPRVQSPFARLRRYLSRRDFFCISSEDVTPPSSLLRTHAPDQNPPAFFGFPYSTGPCRLLSAPAGSWTFPVLSPQFFPWVSGPLPRWASLVLLPVSSQGNIGLLQTLTGSAFPLLPRPATSRRDFLFEAADIPLCSDPQVCSPSWSPLPQCYLLGSDDFYIQAPHDSLPHHALDMLNVRIGQLTFGDFHPIRSVALPAAPKALEVFPPGLVYATVRFNQGSIFIPSAGNQVFDLHDAAGPLLEPMDLSAECGKGAIRLDDKGSS